MNVIRFLMLPFLLFASSAATAENTCFGQFPNFVTDVCWECAFPIKLMGVTVIPADSQEDYDTGVPNLCSCNNSLGVPIAGLHTSFWEAARQIEITRTPYCMVTLGGVQLSLGFNSQMTGTETAANLTAGGAAPKTTFRQVHWYVNPIMSLLQIALDSKCLDVLPFDITYLSEVDPTHADDEMARILAPESYMFGNIVAQLACAADCISATMGFGSNLLYWCDGCNGSVFPLTGNVSDVYGGVQMSEVMVHRTIAKLHRMMTQTSSAGMDGMCGAGGFFQITMDKREYKDTLIYPNAQSSPDPVFGRCCQPLGRSTILWGAGREIPTPAGQDFGYMIFRKRDCCQ